MLCRFKELMDGNKKGSELLH
uniref:Uncharacterized protein n=1 Tax=Anguilla anguilla TaxID=7936 RepID=A0A0E9R8M7_ANGAN